MFVQQLFCYFTRRDFGTSARFFWFWFFFFFFAKTLKGEEVISQWVDIRDIEAPEQRECLMILAFLGYRGALKQSYIC